jgi:NitT/TauT family transport system substrate-binding protein
MFAMRTGGLAMTITRRVFVTSVATALVGGVAACSDSSKTSSSGSTANPQSTKLDVGVVPVIDVAPIYLGVSKGFFDQQHLSLNLKQVASGATIVAEVVSGGLQIGFSNNTSLLIAASKGLPLRLVAAGNKAAGGDYAAIYVKDGSSIKDPKGLVGKTVAVNALNNVGPLTINAALEASGVDPKGVKYVEIAFPDMPAALAQGRVDSVWAVEPFGTAIKSAGSVRAVLRPYTLISDHFPVASYFVNRQYAQSNADIVTRFKTAINQSLDYAQAHPDEVRQILPSYVKLTADVAGKVVLPEWTTDLGTDLLNKTADLATKYGYMSAKPDMTQLAG